MEMVVEVLNMILSIKVLCWDSLVKVLEPLYEYRNTFFLYRNLTKQKKLDIELIMKIMI